MHIIQNTLVACQGDWSAPQNEQAEAGPRPYSAQFRSGKFSSASPYRK